MKVSESTDKEFINKNLPLPDKQFTGKGFRKLSDKEKKTNEFKKRS